MTPLQLRRATKTLGWSYAELARRIGATNVMVWRWGNGLYPVPDQVAEWLNECVRVSGSFPTVPKDWRK